MAPKKDSTSKKVATTSKGDGSKSKGKAKGKAQAHSDDSDPDYNFEDDLPLFEGPFEYTMQEPAPKRKKGSLEPSIFVDDDAQLRWETSMAFKLLHIERGFAVDQGPFQPIMEFHHFHPSLTRAPAYCNASLAREFYANAESKKKEDGDFYYVRGKQVQITSEIINTHLGTPSYPKDPLQYPNNGDLDEALIEELALPGTEWVLNKRGDHLHIRSESLKSDVKIWQKFVVSRLMPSTQTTEVPRKRLYLLSAILGRRSIDAGRIILSSIKSVMGAKSGALYFPVLLEEICAAQGVDVGAGDWRRNPGPITTPLYLKYVHFEQNFLAAQLASGNAPQAENGHEHEAGGSRNGHAPYDFQSFQDILQPLQQSMEHRLTTMDDRLVRVEHRVSGMDERLERMHEGLDTFHQGWDSLASTMMARLDDMANVSQQQFEVLFHRQMVTQIEVDKGNKMAVYYHSDSGPPKPAPTVAQLTGCHPPNLTKDAGSGTFYEVPPGVQTTPYGLPLPSFGHVPQLPRTPTFVPRPGFDPATRIPMLSAGHPSQGAQYVPQSVGVPSFVTSSSFAPPVLSLPPASSGDPTMFSQGFPPTSFQGVPPS